MRRMFRHASLIRFALLGPALSALLPSPAQAQDTPQVSIVEHGEFTARRNLPFRERVEGTSGVTDFVLVEGARFVRRTERIEAALCRRFGIWFMTPPPGAGAPLHVTIRLTHPLLTRPDGRSGTVETWPSVADLWPGVAMFSFDNAWEATPGTWTFAILAGGKVLAEQAFDVVAPGRPASPQEDGCGAPTS